MTKAPPVSRDPMLARLLRIPSGLRAGGVSADLLANYHHDGGTRPFAFRHDGLVIDPEGAARFLPFEAMEDASLGNRAMLRSEKRDIENGVRRAGILPLRLASGEIIDLPLNAHPRGMSERLTIAGLIEQRIRIARARARRAQEKAPFARGEGG